MKAQKLITLLLVTFIFYSCGQNPADLEQQVLISKVQSQENLKVLYNGLQELRVQVLYEPNAEPYTGSQAGHDLWEITERNIQEIYKARGKENLIYKVPKKLEEMKQIPFNAKDTWTTNELVEVAKTHGDPFSTTAVAKFVILFVNGHFSDVSGNHPGVIGLNVTGTTVIAVFKDVVKNLSINEDSTVAKFGEQSTIVHEIGHAMGLVNNGVPLTSGHQDEDHGAHCNNQDCVMYWQNEGSKDLAKFVQELIINGNVLLFGPNCLKDMKNFNP